MYVKKKILCPEWDLNCSTPAWRSELLPTGLLIGVDKVLPALPIVMYRETKLAVSQKRKRKSKILFYFFLIRSRTTCTYKIKP